MERAVDLPIEPLADDEWRPWWEPTAAELAGLPEEVDARLLGYPLRAVIGRLRTRAPRGAGHAAQVGWFDGSITSYGDYLLPGPGAGEAASAVERRAFDALCAGEQTGCVFGAVGRPFAGVLAPLRHVEGEGGVLRGVVFDVAISPTVTVFHSDLLVVGGAYLLLELRTVALLPQAVDAATPGRELALLMADHHGSASS